MMALRAKCSAFDGQHLGTQIRFKLNGVAAEMSPPVAVWAKCYYIPWIVRSSIGDPSNMVGLKIGGASRAKEWRRRTAVFAGAGRPSKDVVSHIRGPLINGASTRFTFQHGSCCGVSTSSKQTEVLGRGRRELFLCVVCHSIKRPQLEDNRFSEFPFAIAAIFEVPALADHFVLEDDMPGAILLFEEQQGPSIDKVICDRFVSTCQGHVTRLAFTEVLNQAIGVLAIIVAELKPTLSTDDEYNRVLRWGDDSALALPAEANMNVLAAIVGSATLKSECHFAPLRPQASEISSQSIDSGKGQASDEHGDFSFASSGEERQSSARRGALSFNGAGAERKSPLKRATVRDWPFLGQNEHGVSSAADRHGAGHTRKQYSKRAIPSHRKHFVFPCLTGAINADCVPVVPYQFDEIFMRFAA